ncbi:MAG: M14 family zinc carboxypeptidase, partial [Bacteroidota bacterium]
MKLKLLLILILTNSLLFSGNYKKVKIYLGDLHTAEQLNSIGLEIDHAHFNRDNSIDVFLSDSQFNRLQNSFFQYDIIIDNWNEYYSNKEKLNKFQKETILTQTADKFGVSGFDFGSMGGFYTLDEVYQKLDELFTNYSDLITEKDSIGHTNENRPIYAVKISDNPNVDEDEPEVLYTALHHAREPESMMQMIYFMYYLLENYGTDDEVTYLMENREFYFIPVVNPDGYKYNEETDPNGGGMWRKNKRDNDEDGVFNPSKDGVDLNRNYGYQWAYDDNGSSEDTSSAIYRGTAPFSEPETETVRQFCIAHDFKLALNYHTYSNLLITPWGYIPEETPDSLFYRDIASDMTQYNNYTWGFSAEIIYAVNGDSDDWFYGEQTEKNKIFAMTPEVGESFWPSEDRIIPLAEENVYPNLYLAWVAGAFVNTSNVVFDKEYYSAGDSGSISMNFKNKGLLDAENISSTMISQSSEIEVTSDVIEILKLNSRQESEFPAAFQFKVSNDAIAGESHILKVETYLDNTLMSVDEIKIIVGQPEVYFTDDASNIDDWIEESDVSKKWELTTSNFYSLPSSFTESKIGNYLSNSTVTLTKSTEIDLLNISKPFLSFYTKFSIEKGWDYGQVLISSDSGNVWTPVGGDYSSSGSGQFQPSGVPVYDGKENNWINEIIDISQYIDNKILLRFQLKSDAYIEEDGWYIDDIKVFEYTNKVVSVNNNSDLPVKFMLSQNYPN